MWKSLRNHCLYVEALINKQFALALEHDLVTYEVPLIKLTARSALHVRFKYEL